MGRLRSACAGLPAATTATQELHGTIAAIVMQARGSMQPQQLPVSWRLSYRHDGGCAAVFLFCLSDLYIWAVWATSSIALWQHAAAGE